MPIVGTLVFHDEAFGVRAFDQGGPSPLVESKPGHVGLVLGIPVTQRDERSGIERNADPPFAQSPHFLLA